MISMDKKYRTRDGRYVRILCVDGPDEYPVVGIVCNRGEPDCWTANGRYLDTDLEESNGPVDLIEVAEVRRLKGFLNVREDGSCYWHPAKDIAERAYGKAREYGCYAQVACIDLSRFEYEVGEGLE